MTTTLYLVRHAIYDTVDDVLAGRSDRVSLSDTGRTQARMLAEYFAAIGINGVHASPRRRAQETAHPIAVRSGVPCRTEAALDEIDFGEWTGRRFEALGRDPAWQAWNAERMRAQAPGGEGMAAVQRRALALARACCANRENRRLVLVSHAELIRSLLLHYLGHNLDGWADIEIAPASISTVVVAGEYARVAAVNETVAP